MSEAEGEFPSAPNSSAQRREPEGQGAGRPSLAFPFLAEQERELDWRGETRRFFRF